MFHTITPFLHLLFYKSPLLYRVLDCNPYIVLYRQYCRVILFKLLYAYSHFTVNLGTVLLILSHSLQFRMHSLLHLPASLCRCLLVCLLAYSCDELVIITVQYVTLSRYLSFFIPAFYSFLLRPTFLVVFGRSHHCYHPTILHPSLFSIV